MEKNMRRDNRGFTLIELIVVIAIIGVAMTIGSYALTTIPLARAKNCAEEIEQALMRTRMEACSKDSGGAVSTVSFYYGSDGFYEKKSYESEAVKIGASNLKISYKVGADTEYTELTDQEMIFSFDRSSGAFRNMQVGGTEVGKCRSIQVTGGGKAYTITCYAQTGRTKIE